MYPITGDEPHYATISRAIVDHRTLEMTKTYQETFALNGIDPAVTPLDPANSHTYPGPHGRFSVHSPGLPILMAIPYAIGGTPAVKVGFVFFAATLVIAAWSAAGAFFSSRNAQFIATFAVTSTLPFLAASGQVYPDLLAGIIALCGLLWFHRIREPTALSSDVAVAALLAYLPWLQIKFTLPMLLIVMAAVLRLAQRRAIARLVTLVLATFGSAASFASYNYWAFRSLAGPYDDNALVVGQKPAMVFLALLFDQKQGILFQGPVFWIGLFYLPRFVRRFPGLSVLTIATAMAFLLPNALHTNWFGGWSLVGRFSWGAAAVLLLPTLFGLSELLRKGAAVFVAVVGSLGALQLLLLSRLMFSGTGTEWMNTAPPETMNYPFLYGRLGRLLPALYDVPLARSYWPNLAWFVFAAIVVGLGVVIAFKDNVGDSTQTELAAP